MQVEFTLQTFNTLLQASWLKFPLYYPATTDYYNDLLETGCRPSELLKVELWTLAGSNVRLQPLKGNNERLISKELISNSLLQAITTKTAPYDGISLHQIQHQFKRQYPISPLFVNNKAISLYAFRYFKAKALKEQGYTINQIQNYFGWTNTSIVSVYTSAFIYHT